MQHSYGEPLTKLRAVPIKEDHEPLIDPRTLSRRIHFARKHPKFAEMPRVPVVRETVAKMLTKAAKSLPDGTNIKIIEGYRPLSQQHGMYDQLQKDIADEHPDWNKATLNRITNEVSAPPDDPCPPPHSTGGAIDLCLCRASDLEFLDMSSPLEWDTKSAPPDIDGLSKIARKNRDLLMKTLSDAGLTNYAGEWWHWSYGDSGWALRVGAKYAIYGGINN